MLQITLARALNKRATLIVQRTLATLPPTNDAQQAPEDEAKLSATLKRIKAELLADKEKLRWRTPIGDRPQDWNSKLKLFSDSEQTSDYIVMMQQPIDLSPKAMRQWWTKRQERTERHMQQYIPERHQILGPDLAAAHFILYRGGAAKFVNDARWHRSSAETGEVELPNKYEAGYKVEALRCDNMLLYYEGLENILNLDYLKFLSFHNVKSFDDWCLDRISGGQFGKLEVLDISGTSCTARGLSCLYRLSYSLKLLIVDDPKKTLEFQLAASMLQEAIPLLKIVASDVVHEREQ